MAKKESFTDAYQAADPIHYYSRYAPTRLSIAEYVAALIREIVELGLASGPVVDLGCGYGTLGALLRANLDVEGVYASYLAGRRLRLPERTSYEPTIIGVDRSAAALKAAKLDRLIDDGRAMDLNSTDFEATGFGADAIAVCTAVLGYVQPATLMEAIAAMRPRLAIVTCVTWLAAEFEEASHRQPYAVVQLNRRPLFQRWATAVEESQMPEALIEGAHRADCFLLSSQPVPVNRLAETVEELRARRAASTWLAAGRASGCELGFAFPP
jgi:SAM-dependent methyltransferase